VLVVQHELEAPAGLVGRWLLEAGIDLDVRHPYAGDVVPLTADAHDGVIVLGGGVGAHDDHHAPWLPTVRGLLAASVADGTPTWGICLGGQLLAAATGGRVSRGDVAEAGVCEVVPTAAAADDPLLGSLPAVARVTQYHRDGIAELPPGAVHLATSSRYPHQAFRLGERAWGVQFHPEVDAALVEPWLAVETDIIDSAGVTAADVVAGLRDGLDDLVATWGPVTRAFAAVVQASAPGPAATP
jgi:GMP synthase-like glutamine amidotransferase